MATGGALKRTVDSLAIFGAAPSFSEPLHVGRPNIGDRDKLLARIDGALDRRWLTNDGPLVRELEARLATYLEVDHCIAVSNATAGLEVLAKALQLDGEVIMPAFTFIATPHAFSWVGLQPVFCDVLPRTHCIDPAHAVELLGPRTAAIVGVHLWGNACNVDALQAVCHERKTALLFDAAHAFGNSVGGKRIGGFGNAEVFSFHATKFFNTFEGGAITTNDAGLARELRLMRNFGFSGYDEISAPGINAKMNEICAAMGLVSLDAVDSFVAVNRARRSQYATELNSLTGVRLVRGNEGEDRNEQYLVLEIGEHTGLTRDQLLAILWAEGVRARRYFYPGCHRAAPYATDATVSLPVTEKLVNEVLVLPTGGSVSAGEVSSICELIRFAIEHADELRDRIPAAIPPSWFNG